jgi:hypothetical protein
MQKYKIVRHYLNGKLTKRTINTGLTLEQAQEHCGDKETSSRTCKKYAGRKRTERYGAWFDGYSEDN